MVSGYRVEIARLEADKSDSFRAGTRGRPGLARLIRAGYNLLGLVTFHCRVQKTGHGQLSLQTPEAAGVIHTDFQRGFIRAETIAYDDYINKGEAGAKEEGKLRIENDYKVVDGDILHFRFNV